MHCISIKRPLIILSVLFLGFAGNGMAGDPHGAYYGQTNDKIFWFIQTSDIHIGASGSQDSSNLNWLVTEARQIIAPSFIIVTGDLTDSTNGNILGLPNGPYQAEWNEYKSIVNIPGISADNYYDIPGNHDAYNDKYFSYYTANSVQGRATGQTQVSFAKEFSFGKFHFLGINTADNTGASFSIFPPYGDHAGLDVNELGFIESQMNAHSDANLSLVFGHHPLFPTGNSADTYVYYGRDTLLSIINQSYTSLYGYGHTHTSSEAFFIPNTSLHDGFFYFNIDSLGKSTENQYTIMAIDSNGLSSKIRTVGQWPAVLITAPLDQNMGGYNPYAYKVPAASSNPIRALVFDPGTNPSVQYRIDGASQWLPMYQASQNFRLWEASWDASSLAQGQHTIEVVASSASGTSSDIITVGVERTSQLTKIGAAFKEIGTYVTTGNKRNKTTVFVPDTDNLFQSGDAVVFRLQIKDAAGSLISGATVLLDISGPESFLLTSAPSDSQGIAEVVWQTSVPNKRGRGGTTLGAYIAGIAGVTATGYVWDNEMPTWQVEIQ